jgi:hypothetical protein
MPLIFFQSQTELADNNKQLPEIMQAVHNHLKKYKYNTTRSLINTKITLRRKSGRSRPNKE